MQHVASTFSENNVKYPLMRDSNFVFACSNLVRNCRAKHLNQATLPRKTIELLYCVHDVTGGTRGDAVAEVLSHGTEILASLDLNNIFCQHKRVNAEDCQNHSCLPRSEPDRNMFR